MSKSDRIKRQRQAKQARLNSDRRCLAHGEALCCTPQEASHKEQTQGFVRWYAAGRSIVQVRRGRVVSAKRAAWLVGKDVRTAKALCRRRGIAFYEVCREGLVIED